MGRGMSGKPPWTVQPTNKESIMSKAVRIYVLDNTGHGLSGQRVKEYRGNEVRTDSSGCASLLLESPSTTIYVNGFEAYDGYVSRLPDKLLVKTTGERF